MINIELTMEAQKAVDEACAKAGMKKRELVARVLRWFANQSDEVRALVLGSIPMSVAPMVAKHLLEDIANVDTLVGHIDMGRGGAPAAGGNASNPAAPQRKAPRPVGK